jgi:hypothetical protein
MNLGAAACYSCAAETIPLAVQTQKRQHAFSAIDATLESD